MLFLVAAMAAEMERDLIRERTLDGLAAAAQGRKGGRPVAIDDDTLAAARMRRTRGETIPAIAKALGVGRSTLYRALEDDSPTREGLTMSENDRHADTITYALHRGLTPADRAEVLGELTPREREEVEAALDCHRERLAADR
jgi:hypothetical protein